MEMKFDFDDILIEPAPVTSITSRSQINIFDENDMLPLFAAPMDTVVSSKNSQLFSENKIYAIQPRIADAPDNYYSTNPFCWYSYGLKDFYKILYC